MYPLPIEADGICVRALHNNLYDTTHYGKQNTTEREHLTYIDDPERCICFCGVALIYCKLYFLFQSYSGRTPLELLACCMYLHYEHTHAAALYSAFC